MHTFICIVHICNIYELDMTIDSNMTEARFISSKMLYANVIDFYTIRGSDNN